MEWGLWMGIMDGIMAYGFGFGFGFGFGGVIAKRLIAPLGARVDGVARRLRVGRRIPKGVLSIMMEVRVSVAVWAWASGAIGVLHCLGAEGIGQEQRAHELMEQM